MNVDNETETKIIERLDSQVERLDRIASGVDKLVEAIPKPASRLWRIGETFALIAAVLSIIGIIEIIRNWIIGG